MFKNNNMDLLILSGLGGLSKSKIVEEAMREREYLKIVSHISPMRLFILGYKHQHQPVVFDDVDCILQSDSNIALLKMFCDTSETKEISWFSTSAKLDEQGIPETYSTRSKIVIICNNFDQLSDKVTALKDRGWHIEFKPSNNELLAKMREILPEVHKELSIEERTQVYQVIESYANVAEISIRTFIKGLFLYKECKAKGVDWRSILLQSIEINPKLVLLDKILRDYEKEADRIEAWIKEGYSRRNYYEFKLKLGADVRSPAENRPKDPSLEATSNLAQPILTTQNGV